MRRLPLIASMILGFAMMAFAQSPTATRQTQPPSASARFSEHRRARHGRTHYHHRARARHRHHHHKQV